MKKKFNSSLRLSVTLAMLAAISIIAGKFLAIRGGDILRFSFENLPILFAGIAFGPLAGGVVAVCADLIGCVMVSYTVNPIVTLGAAVVGVSAGVFANLFKNLNLSKTPKIILSVALPHFLGSVIVKSFGLAVFYTMPLPMLMVWRLLNYLIVGFIEGALLIILFKNKAITKFIKSIRLTEVKSTTTMMNYDETLKYIHGVSGIFCKPGLEIIDELCRKLGNPQDSLKFIHVAGTNGKGSFSAMTDSVLREAGYKVGLYTSPYIYEFGERMRVNGKNIPKDVLCEITEQVKCFADQMTDKPTEFELITAIAFEYFKREKVDVVVLEVGLGGRLDSTNIIRNPILSVITGIALDHTAFLGDTVEKIAMEKAGIIKDTVPVIYGGVDSEAGKIIEQIALCRNSKFYRTDYSKLAVKKATMEGTVFDYKTLIDVEIGLLGLYQPQNAALVIDAIEIIRSKGFDISEDALYKGLQSANWRGRFEIIKKEPTVIFDGAHNPQGIRACVDSILHYYKGKKLAIVTGVMKDKDYAEIAKTLSEIALCVFTVTPDNPRALPASEYADVLKTFGIDSHPKATIEEALKAGIEFAKTNDTALCCLGSLYTYVEIYDAIKEL